MDVLYDFFYTVLLSNSCSEWVHCFTKSIIIFCFAFVWYLVSHIQGSTVKIVCNGTARDRTLFPLHAGSVLSRCFKVWTEETPDLLNCKHLPLKTGFRYAQVPFKTGFSVYIRSIDYIWGQGVKDKTGA